MTNSVAVIGSYNTDLTIKAGSIPRPGETVLGGVFTRGGGGKGANQAVAAARVGAGVSMIAKVGDDPLGREAVARLTAERIDTRYVLLDPDFPTGVAFIMVDSLGENSIVVASGANSRLSAADVEGASAAIRGASVLLVQLESPLEAVRAAVRIAHGCGSLVILNPAPVTALDNALLREVDIITPNALEAEMLTGVPISGTESLKAAAGALLGHGISRVLITLGSRGVFSATAESSGLIPAFKVGAVDSTGAGDVFNGALAAFLAGGTKVEDAIRKASGAAAIAVTRMGAQVSTPFRPEIEAFISGRSAPEAVGKN
jgi:ribokinase